MNVQTPVPTAPATASAAPTGAPGTFAASGPPLYGVIDVVRTDRIAGWVIDRRDPRAYAQVTVLREGRAVATVRADRHRPDLEKGGVGSGRYGFSVPLEPPLDAGLEFTLGAVARGLDGTELSLRPTGAAAPAPERRLLERLWEDLAEVRATTERTAADLTGAIERLASAVDRIEVIQARLEAGSEAPPLPRRRGPATLWALAGVAVAAGLGSLALGLWSLW